MSWIGCLYTQSMTFATYFWSLLDLWLFSTYLYFPVMQSKGPMHYQVEYFTTYYMSSHIHIVLKLIPSYTIHNRCVWAFKLNLIIATPTSYRKLLLSHAYSMVHKYSHTRIVGQVGIRCRYQTLGVKDPSPTSNCHLHISWCTPLGHSTHHTQRLCRYNRGTHLDIHYAVSAPTNS